MVEQSQHGVQRPACTTGGVAGEFDDREFVPDLSRFLKSTGLIIPRGPILAVVPEEGGDWLSLWALVVGERYACAGHALKQIPCLQRIDVSRSLLHSGSKPVVPEHVWLRVSLLRDFIAAWAASIPVIMAPVNPPVPP